MKPFWIAIVALGVWTSNAQCAFAQARDGLYRGTLVCGAATLQPGNPRVSIELTIEGNAIQYKRPVVERGEVLSGNETGSGKLERNKFTLAGSWRGDKLGFDAIYIGTFVRDTSIKFTGSQTWTHEGTSAVRKCSGVAKRPTLFRRSRG